jgi:hypothetical protein
MRLDPSSFKKNFGPLQTCMLIVFSCILELLLVQEPFLNNKCLEYLESDGEDQGHV